MFFLNIAIVSYKIYYDDYYQMLVKCRIILAMSLTCPVRTGDMCTKNMSLKLKGNPADEPFALQSRDKLCWLLFCSVVPPPFNPRGVGPTMRVKWR